MDRAASRVLIQLSSLPPPLGTGDEVFPEDWEPVIEELPPPSAEPGALDKRGIPGEIAAPHAAVRTFHGKLESIATLDVLKALAQSRASGIMSFETNPQGAVLLEDGLIVAASWGELNGAHALAQLLLLESGTFRVGAHLHEVMTEDARAPQALLLEALQLVAQRRARSGAEEGASRPAERPSPRTFRLPGGKASLNGKAAVDGKASVSEKVTVSGKASLNGKAAVNGRAAVSVNAGVNGKAIANGNHSEGPGSKDGTIARRSLLDALLRTSATRNHTSGKHTPAEPNAPLTVPVSEPNQAPQGPAEPSSPARPPSTLSAALTPVPPLSGEASPKPPSNSPAASSILRPPQLRSKSLWWMEIEPRLPVAQSDDERFTRRALGKLRGGTKPRL